jgi:hypothetical protein
MDSTFYYSESARRRAKKLEALAQGDVRQGAIPPDPACKPTPPAASATAGPARPSPGRAGRVATKPVRGPVPAAQKGPAIRRPAGAETLGGGIYRKTRPAPAPRGARPARGAAAPVAVLKANEERLLLESQALDLFGTGKGSKVCVCPDCQHEIVKVVCLGTPVRACLECKGVWLSYPVVREFARGQDWFIQLGPAIQLEIDKKRKLRG